MQTIATLIPAHPNFEQMVMFSAVGFLVVLFVLMFLSLMTSFIGKFFSLAQGGASKPAAAKPAAASKHEIPEGHAFAISAAVASVLPELRDERAELIAVLSAAAAVAIEEECRVVSVKLAAPDMSFARQGRMQIFASKNYTPVKFN